MASYNAADLGATPNQDDEYLKNQMYQPQGSALAGAGQMLAGYNPAGGDVRPGPTYPPPTTTPPPIDRQPNTPTTSGAAAGADPFTAMGGGVNINGNWFPKDHPGAIEWMKNNPQSAAPAAGAPAIPGTPGTPATPGAPASGNPADIAKAASTVSATPGAAPTANTTNQGTQDVFRNSLLERATQSTAVDPNDPNIKQQVDPFAAAQERSRRQYESEAAERLSAKGMGSSGAMDAERRFGAERAGQATGMFQSQLVQGELQNKRNEIQDALTQLGDSISGDQKNALTQKLADLDATLKREGYASGERISSADNATKREGIASGERVGNREIDVKDRLGTAANNNDLIRSMLQNQQIQDGASLDWSKFDWDTSPMNPKNQ